MSFQPYLMACSVEVGKTLPIKAMASGMTRRNHTEQEILCENLNGKYGLRVKHWRREKHLSRGINALFGINYINIQTDNFILMAILLTNHFTLNFQHFL